MLNPALSESDILQRTIKGVIDRGKCRGLASMRVTLNAMAADNVRFAIVANDVPFVTHWWLLEMMSGHRQVYIGTEKTFAMFQATGKGHAFEFKYQGLEDW